MNSSRLHIAAADVTGIVLAGGRGSRMGGVDKGLQLFSGRPLAQHALERLRLQVGLLAVNANRHLDIYASFGVPVWPDELPDHAGPLAGFATALQHCKTPWLATVPCDTPLFPDDLVRQLAQALQQGGADIAMASAPERDMQGHSTWHRQPAFCLLGTGLLPSLEQFLAQGGRKIGAWTAQHSTVHVRFDSAVAFSNANTLAELQALQA